MNKHFNIKIFGRVQGVFFRISAKEEAEKLGIVGLARNEKDGSVSIEAEGDEKKLDEFISWCKIGPQSAKVESVQIKQGKIKNFTEFSRDFNDF